MPGACLPSLAIVMMALRQGITPYVGSARKPPECIS